MAPPRPGWVIADLDAYDASPRALVNRAGCIVVSVEYRRAPEHPFPAAHDDVLAATRWVFAHAAELGGDPARIAIAGESAGGNMATATCLSLKVAREPLPIFQLLLYPVAQIGEETDSYRVRRPQRADAALVRRPRAAGRGPARPRLPDLPAATAGGGPAWAAAAHVITAEVDPLRDEGEAYGAHLREAGIPVKVQRYQGAMHEFFGMSPVLAQADKAMDEAAAALRETFTARP